MNNKTSSDKSLQSDFTDIQYKVVRNQEGRFACIRQSIAISNGWSDTGVHGSKEQCAQWVDENWKSALMLSKKVNDALPLLAAVYDDGAASAYDIVDDLSAHFKLVFVITSNQHSRERASYLQRFGLVIDGGELDSAKRELSLLGPDGIVTYSERALRLSAELAAHLLLRFHDIQTILNLTDKFRQRKCLNSFGVESIRYALIESQADWLQAVEHVGLPAVLKPVYGGGSIDTNLITSQQQGESLLSELFTRDSIGFSGGNALILEEYLVGKKCLPYGDYVSVESFVDGDEVNHLGITGKMPLSPPFREYGHFWPSPLDNFTQEQVSQLAEQAIKALGIKSGITHIEIKLTETGPRIIEVNGRLGGGIYELSKLSYDKSLLLLAAQQAVGASYTLANVALNNVFFNINHIAPTQPCTVLAINNEQFVEALPSVHHYKSYLWNGIHLEGGTHTREINIILGQCEDHAEFLTLFKLLSESIFYEVKFDSQADSNVLTAEQFGAI